MRARSNVRPSGGASAAFVDGWARVLNALNSGLDQVDQGRAEVDSMLIDQGRRERFGRAITGSSWATWYDRPAALLFCAAAAVIFPLGAIAGLMDRHGIGRALGKWGFGNISNSAGEVEFVFFPRLGASAWKLIDAQCRAVVSFRRTMNDLVRDGANGDDQAFVDAIRIDPGVLSSAACAARIHAAVATNDEEFIKKVCSALRNPVPRGALTHSRLHCALWLMHCARVLSKLDQKSAYELFAVRTRLYTVHGREDSPGSLWRLIQRWKREAATNSGEEMSS